MRVGVEGELVALQIVNGKGLASCVLSLSLLAAFVWGEWRGSRFKAYSGHGACAALGVSPVAG